MNKKEYTYDISTFKEVFNHEFTYINGFLRNVHRFANRPALTCPVREKTWTYTDLNLEVNRLAKALQEDGIGANDIVMYQILNAAEFVFLFLAPQKLGVINCPINFRLAPGETAYIIDESKPKVFVYDAEMRQDALKALSMAEHKPERIIMVDVYSKVTAPPGHILYEDYIRNKAIDEPQTSFISDIYTETTRLYTSGTTGLPKGVPLNNAIEVL